MTKTKDSQSCDRNPDVFGQVLTSPAVKSAFIRSARVIQLATLLTKHGYRVEVPETAGYFYFRYALYAPQGWSASDHWYNYLADAKAYPFVPNEPKLFRNDGYLGDFIVTDDGIDGLLPDPPEFAEFDVLYCQEIMKLATLLEISSRAK